MVNVNDAFELKYKKDNNQFEVLVDFEKLNEFKKKPDEIPVYDVVADTKIFKDQKKGEIASANIIEETFRTSNKEIILKEILLKGECQIPTSFLNKLRAQKREHIINYITENSQNPQTKLKYTPTMIASEIDKLKYNYDPNKDFTLQAEEVLKLLKKLMPISMEKIKIQVEIPGQFCGNFYGSFRKYGKIIKESYNNLGNLVMQIEIMESRLDDITTFIKNNSNGEAAYFLIK